MLRFTMKKPILLPTISVLAFVFATNSFAQEIRESTVPESVRDMILRSQADTQFEQTARVQIDVQYGDFLRSLAAQPLKRNQVEEVLVELFSERAELSLRVAQNKASPDQLKVITQYEYVRSRLESLLTMAELGVIDAQRGGATDQQLKNGYAEELSRTTGNLNDADKDLLLDIIVKHIRMAQGETGRMNAQSVEELIEKQGASFMHARMEMESLFDEVQLEQVDQFMGRLHNNLYRNRSMSDQ
jgi:chorismate mutase